MMSVGELSWYSLQQEVVAIFSTVAYYISMCSRVKINHVIGAPDPWFW